MYLLQDVRLAHSCGANEQEVALVDIDMGRFGRVIGNIKAMKRFVFNGVRAVKRPHGLFMAWILILTQRKISETLLGMAVSRRLTFEWVCVAATLEKLAVASEPLPHKPFLRVSLLVLMLMPTA